MWLHPHYTGVNQMSLHLKWPINWLLAPEPVQANNKGNCPLWRGLSMDSPHKGTAGQKAFSWCHHTIYLLPFFRYASLPQGWSYNGQSYDCLNAREATMKEMGNIGQNETTTRHAQYQEGFKFIVRVNQGGDLGHQISGEYNARWVVW